MKASLLSLCAVLALTSGCAPPHWTLQWSQAELVDEQAALIRQYRECLARAETDPEVDCSGYRTAVEVIDARSD